MALENNENTNVIQEEEGLSIKDILVIIRKYLLEIVLFIVVFTAIGFGYAKYNQKKSPEYNVTSTVMIYVDPTLTNNSLNTSYSLSQNITDTCIAFVEEDIVLEQVLDNEKAAYPDLTLKSLKKSISAAMNGDSLFMVVSYTDKNPEKAAIILNDVVETMIETADSQTTTTDSEGNVTVKPTYQLLYNTLSVCTKADAGKYTLTSKTLKYTLIFFAVGLVLAVVYVVIRELTDNRFRNSEEVEKMLGVPVLAGIPDYDTDPQQGGKK